ncbi:MAG: penicillin acylase family protein [Chloroflexota bacterium]|nr:penicillin acylase family protein [Chloroflexota bacterium]
MARPRLGWQRAALRVALGRRLPLTRGRLRVEGLEGEVRIVRDRWGIPHVDAGSDSDAWFALGLCHAQDRPFQLETMLRVGRGTLAALVGVGGLPLDRLSRRLGFARTAIRQHEVIEAAVRRTIDAYVAGINAGLEHGLRRSPHELALLRARPTRWTATDVLAFVGLQSFALSANWDTELARLKILAEDGPDALQALDGAYPEWHPVSAPVAALAGPTADHLARDLATLLAIGPGGASNNWALAPSRTANGATIVANDPHLASRLPAPWYLAHLRTPEWAVAGASYVGGPAFPIGHNGFAAWGITAGLTDTCDLFIEELGADGRSVRRGEAWEACEVIEERIEVKGAPPTVEQVLITPRGPIISPLLDGLPYTLSLRAIWQQTLPIRGFLESVRARSFEELRAPFAAWPGPALNVVYGDADGHIGWQLVGQLPRRRRGSGTVPLPASDPQVGWEAEPVPFTEMPCLYDPDIGFVATANNQPVRDGEGPFLGADWIDGYRLAAIEAELAARSDWDVARTQALQVNRRSAAWADLRDSVMQAAPTTDAAARGLELLRAWDGSLDPESAAASVYELFIADLSRRMAELKAPRGWPWVLGAGFGAAVPYTMFHTRLLGRVVRLVRERPAGWTPNDDWPALLATSLGSAVERLEKERGPDPRSWQWGALRPLTLNHPAGDRRFFASVFNLGPMQVGGDGNTVLQAGTTPLDPLSNPGVIPNTRVVMVPADPEASRFVLAGGQSGNPFSPHYADLLAWWQRGDGVPIAWSEEAVRIATRERLVLTPPG